MTIESPKTDLHISTTGQTFSFFPKGGDRSDRVGLFSGFRYGSRKGPDAVLVTYAIQGAGYFEGLIEHFDEISEGLRVVMGFVWDRHVPIYRRALRGKAEVEILFHGHPYGMDQPPMPWICVWKGER